jgi:tol-pal system protein YbgF
MKRLFLSLCLGCAVIMPANALEPGTPVIKVQSGDAAYRISVLEEQIRQLNGRIEELTFQLLEMQEKIRRQNEDNEFRFQELEEKGSLENGSSGNLAASAEGDDGLEKPEPSDQTVINTDTDGTSATRETQTATASIGNEPAANAPTIDGVEIFQGEPGLDPNPSGTLGTIQFDANGNIVDSTIGKPLDLTALPRAGEESDVLPGDANELFDLGYDHVQTGRYEDAEKALVRFSEIHSDHPRLPEARFWLGESYLGRSQFKQAAEVYLDAQNRWPNGKFGPQTLLKLGVSLAGLNQRELACATFAKVVQKYPNSSRVVRRNVSYEQNAARCLTN